MRRIEQGDNKFMQRILREIKGGRSEWMKETRRCLEWAGVAEGEVRSISGEEVKRRVGRVVGGGLERAVGTEEYPQYVQEVQDGDERGGLLRTDERKAVVPGSDKLHEAGKQKLRRGKQSL